MTRTLRWVFFAIIVRPIIAIVFGLNVRHRERLPARGPCIIVANHNSHLDTMVLMSLFALRQLPRLRPVAAADYFLRSPLLGWFSTEVVGIIGIDREARRRGCDPLRAPSEALARGDILILFPEGSRGGPEKLAEFKKGVWYLAASHPEVPVIPCFMHGLGKSLPKGAALPVPLFLDVFVGEPLEWRDSRDDYMRELQARVRALAEEDRFPEWE